eukprot:symbB.v1.2.042203.t1/scaffold9454.1/size3223/1
MQYSNFGFFPRQIGARRVICPMIFVRLLCGGALLFIVQSGDCSSLTSAFFCKCTPPERGGIWGWEWKSHSDSGREWVCNGSPELWLYNKETVNTHYDLDNDPSAQRLFAKGKGSGVCGGNDLEGIFSGQRYTSSDLPTFLGLDLDSPRWCASESSMPAMLSPSCQRDEFDPGAFQVCRKSVREVFETMCSGRFLVCAIWVGKNPVIFTYLFVPTAALLVLVLMHCVAQLCSASLADVEENKPFRKEIRRQAKKHQEQLQTGNLDHSLWLARATLAFQLSFFLLDIAS